MQVWDIPGKNAACERYRTSENSKELRNWVVRAYKDSKEYLDKDWVNNLRNNDFYSRLWELKLSCLLRSTNLKLIPQYGNGFDFCIELRDNTRIWIEAVYSHPDDKLKEFEREALNLNGELYDIPKDSIALRYSSSLFGKAEKIKRKYINTIGANDIVLIAVSSFGPEITTRGRDIFEYAILPIGVPPDLSTIRNKTGDY